MHVGMHALMHTCIHICRHTSMHVCRPLSVAEWIRRWLSNPGMVGSNPAQNFHFCIHTYISYMHRYIHTYITIGNIIEKDKINHFICQDLHGMIILQALVVIYLRNFDFCESTYCIVKVEISSCSRNFDFRIGNFKIRVVGTPYLYVYIYAMKIFISGS